MVKVKKGGGRIDGYNHAKEVEKPLTDRFPRLKHPSTRNAYPDDHWPGWP